MATNDHVDFRPSSAWPVVLSVTHGGLDKLNSISDHTSGCLEPDWQSYELASETMQSFQQRGGEAPAEGR